MSLKVSHELPLSLMHYSYKWNDFEYCLPHLLDKYDQYRIFFQKARLDKRFIIMDNGLFEGYTHTKEDLVDKIHLVQPNIFIVPDAWNDSAQTLMNAKNWYNEQFYHKLIPHNVNLMAVCQGKTMDELIQTYQILFDVGYRYIAFNHSSVAYTTFYPNHPPLKAQMFGRMELVRRLVEKNIIDKSIYHHLLGASDFKEFMAYSDWEFIKSVDTSSPIINGYNGFKFDLETPYEKPKEKLEDIMELDLSDKFELIEENVNFFRGLAK